MRSAVHSKNYMQRLLVDALKKAGYEKRDEDEENEKISIAGEIRKRIKNQKEKGKYQTNKLKVSESLLE